MALSAEDQRKAVIAVVVVVLVAGASFFLPGFGINDTNKKINKLNRDIVDEKKTLTEMKNTVAKKDDLILQINRMKPELAEQESRLPNFANIQDLLRDLQAKGVEHDVFWVNLTGEESQRNTQQGYEEFPIKMELMVDYHGLGNFLNEVENGERLVRIENLEITNGSDQKVADESHDWSVQKVTMDLSTFRFIQKAKSGSDE